jgi:hypothetical protein
MTRSPSRLKLRGIFSKIASQIDKEIVPSRLLYRVFAPNIFQAKMNNGILMMRFITEIGMLKR